MAAGIPKDAASIQATVTAFAAAGADTLLFVPTGNDLGQLDLLVDALGGQTTVEP
jgi:hypothetical protein